MSEVRSGPRVLVVEDEAQIRYALRRYLESNGYQVREAEDGATALREFDLFKPDVLLLDLMLPDMSGVEIVRQIRQSHETPMVVVSAVGDERTKVHALDEGADDYLTKPFRHGGAAGAPARRPAARDPHVGQGRPHRDRRPRDRPGAAPGHADEAAKCT